MKTIAKLLLVIVAGIILLAGVIAGAYKTGEYRTEIRIWRTRFNNARGNSKPTATNRLSNSNPFGGR